MFCQDLVKYCSCAVFHDKLNAKFKWKEDEKHEWCHRTLESSNWCTTSSITWVCVCFMTISHSEFEGNTPVVKWTGLAAAQCGCTCYSAGTLFALFSKTLRHTTGWAKTGIKNNVRKLADLKARSHLCHNKKLKILKANAYQRGGIYKLWGYNPSFSFIGSIKWDIQMLYLGWYSYF